MKKFSVNSAEKKVLIMPRILLNSIKQLFWTLLVPIIFLSQQMGDLWKRKGKKLINPQRIAKKMRKFQLKNLPLKTTQLNLSVYVDSSWLVWRVISQNGMIYSRKCDNPDKIEKKQVTRGAQKSQKPRNFIVNLSAKVWNFGELWHNV